MSSWISTFFKIIGCVGICLVAVVAIIYGPRLYKIANPPLNHTLFWVRGNQSQLSSLIQKGVDVNKPTHQGRTPLHFAAQYGQVEHLALLIDAGADISAQDHLGQSVLHYAVNGGTAKSITFLLSHGASANISDASGISVLHRAVSLGASGVTEGQSVALLLAASADIAARNNQGDTPIHWATTSYYLNQTLLPLLKAGGNPNSANDEGESALHIACKAGDETAVMMLLDFGAKTSTQNKKGHTPFDIALKRSRPLTANTMARLRLKTNR